MTSKINNINELETAPFAITTANSRDTLNRCFPGINWGLMRNPQVCYDVLKFQLSSNESNLAFLPVNYEEGIELFFSYEQNGLGEVINKSLLDSLYPFVKNAFTYHYELMLVPDDLNFLCMFVNKDRFNELNIAIPKDFSQLTNILIDYSKRHKKPSVETLSYSQDNFKNLVTSLLVTLVPSLKQNLGGVTIDELYVVYNWLYDMTHVHKCLSFNSKALFRLFSIENKVMDKNAMIYMFWNKQLTYFSDDNLEKFKLCSFNLNEKDPLFVVKGRGWFLPSNFSDKDLQRKIVSKYFEIFGEDNKLKDDFSAFSCFQNPKMMAFSEPYISKAGKIRDLSNNLIWTHNIPQIIADCSLEMLYALQKKITSVQFQNDIKEKYFSDLENKLPSRFNNMVEYIDRNIDKIDTVNTLCDELKISDVHLNRLFKKFFNKTAKSYIQEQKLIKCRLLLKTTGSSINDISEKVGFNSVSSFSKIYKNFYGVSPSNDR